MKDLNIFMTELFPYLEGEELKDSTLTLTIKGIRQEDMKSHGGKEESKYVLYFVETAKGFVLNKTNAKRIAVLHGKMTGGWAGKQITLYTEEVRAFGETHNALRVAEASPDNSTGNGDMNLGKLLALLRKVEVTGMATFYEFPDDILACRAKGAPLPPADDVEGWRVLYTDARDFAIDRINEAIERGDLSPDEISIPQTTTGKTSMDAIEDEKIPPDQSQMSEAEAARSAMDQVEDHEDERPF